MLIEIITVWNCAGARWTPFRRCAVFFSCIDCLSWTFIIMLQTSPIESHDLMLSCFVVDVGGTPENGHGKVAAIDNAALSRIRLRPKFISDEELIHHVQYMLKENDKRLLPGLLYDVISGIAKIEIESPVALAAIVRLFILVWLIEDVRKEYYSTISSPPLSRNSQA